VRKFHKLLNGDQGALHEQLLPTDGQERFLRGAKNKIRNHLRVGIEQASMEVLNTDKSVSPRFRTQGSWAYGSCIQPARQPPQEMDWDYGVYLPVDLLDDNVTPRVAAQAYFDLVEGLLIDLCARNGDWALGEKKDRCIRVSVGNDTHVDVALYAAPADQFAEVNDRLVEATKAYGTADFALSMEQRLSEAAEISAEQSWADFEGMMVATRNGEWEASDAEVIAQWFRDQKDIHGEQLQRVWRYLKAWRDFQWTKGGPSSVTLMLIACRHFERFTGRDDKALIHLAKHLPEAIAQDVVEEGIDPTHDFNRSLTPEKREEARRRAAWFAKALEEVRTNVVQPQAEVIALLRQQWGPRIPNRPQGVEYDSPADQVRETPARQVVVPPVNRSWAG
jgi:hypothetical protein